MEHDSDLEKTVQAFSAALKSSMSNRHNNIECEFCGKNGHTENKCFLNPENPNNKLTPKMLAAMSSNNSGEKKKSLKDKNKNKVELAGSVVEKTTITPPKDLKTYADSGATIHCFYDKTLFTAGSLVNCDERTILFADKTSSVSSLMGEVKIEIEHAILRLEDVLYVPSMGYNLVSTGRLADNGIESIFRRNDFFLATGGGLESYWRWLA